MTTHTYPVLSQFLGAYFHQDWPEKFADPEAAIAAFRSNESEETVRAACTELDRASREVQQVADPSRLVSALGCYYDPQADGQSATDWLDHVRSELMSALVTS